MHIFDDDRIVDTDVLRSRFKHVVTLAKAASIPDVKKIRDVSELLDDKLRAVRRTTKDLSGLAGLDGLSRSSSLSILNKYPTGVNLAKFTMDRSIVNLMNVTSYLTTELAYAENSVKELWSTISVLVEDLPNADHIVDLNREFTEAMSDATDNQVILDYINTDSTLASKLDTALSKKKAGKTNSIIRIIGDVEINTAYDLIKHLAKYNPIDKVTGGYERVKEVKVSDVDPGDMEKVVAQLLKYARDTKDYNLVVKWACSSILKNVLATS